VASGDLDASKPEGQMTLLSDLIQDCPGDNCILEAVTEHLHKGGRDDKTRNWLLSARPAQGCHPAVRRIFTTVFLTDKTSFNIDPFWTFFYKEAVYIGNSVDALGFEVFKNTKQRVVPRELNILYKNLY